MQRAATVMVRLFPPAREALLLVIKHHGRANHRREKSVAPSFICGGDTPKGVVPGVPGKRELADMARKQGICLQVLCRSCRFLRGHMDVRPLLVILAGIEDYEVKPSESLTDFSEVRSVTRVTTQEDPSTGSRYCISNPK